MAGPSHLLIGCRSGRSLSSGDDAPFGSALVTGRPIAAMGCKVRARTALNRCSDPGPTEMGPKPRLRER
jgi:hypothetical protein